ncbi:MAG: GNAT family N-acetyltransferase, partial [Blastocatellia bacterium]|nr:GNAT family N-acetyltransferase [Blastocatellia bacterium]
ASIPRIFCTVQHHYSGVRLFANGERLIIASPPARAELIKEATVGVIPEEAFSVDWLQRVFADDAEKILGPAEVCYADEASFRTEPNHNGRALLAKDYDAYRALVESLDPKEVEESGVRFPDSRCQFPDAFSAFGVFSDDILCSVASYEVWEPSIAHIHIITHPNYRRRGYARAAVQALAAEALDRGLILQWRAVAWNEASLSLAHALGFEYYCSTLYIRLRNPV